MGLGVGAGPNYEGSEDYEPLPLGSFSAVRDDNLSVEVRGPRASGNLVPKSIVRAGAVLQYRFERDDVENDQIGDLEDVGGTLELGGARVDASRHSGRSPAIRGCRRCWEPVGDTYEAA